MVDRRDEDEDWIETAVRIATRLGLNGMRVRWKLMRLQQQWRRTGRVAEQQVDHIRYEHKVCPECGRVVDRSDTVCPKCGEKLSSRRWQVLERIGVSVPSMVSVSSLLGAAMLVVYASMMRAAPAGEGWLSMPSDVLVRFGAHYPPAIRDGEWWRWGTAIFLHIGLWHLGFNLFALAQIGPTIEKTFGRWRMLFLFMATGIAANVGSGLLGLDGIAAGASGALMGLIGLAAGWGQRDGTSIGRDIRNRMLKWALYTMVFGMFIGADNAAHGVGFVAGAVLGYAIPVARSKSASFGVMDALMGVTGVVAALGSIYFTMAPPKGARDWAAEWRAAEVELGDEGDEAVDESPKWNAALREACPLWRRGDEQGARERLRDAMGQAYDLTDDAGVSPVKLWCNYYEGMRRTCARWRAGELAGQMHTGDPEVDEQVARAWTARCEGVEPEEAGRDAE